MHRRRASGALYVRWEEAKKIVYLRDGAPVMVKSNLLDECLGRVMVRERMITEEECEQSLRLMRSSRRQQGTVLIEMGCISPHNLVYALDRQLRLKLYDIFAWRGGEFTFAAGVEAPPSHTGLEGSPGQLIKEGIFETYDHSRVVEALAAQRAQRLWPATDALHRFQDLGLTSAERGLVDHVVDNAGQWTVAEVLRGASGLGNSDLDVLARAQLVLALLCVEVLLLGQHMEDSGSWTGPDGVSTDPELGVGLNLDDESGQTPTDEDDLPLSAEDFRNDVDPVLAEMDIATDPSLDSDTLDTARNPALQPASTELEEPYEITSEDLNDDEEEAGTEETDTDVGQRVTTPMSAVRIEDDDDDDDDDVETAVRKRQYTEHDGSKRLPVLGDGAVTPDDVRRELRARRRDDRSRPTRRDRPHGDASDVEDTLFPLSDTSQTDVEEHTALAAIRRTELVRRLARMQGRAAHDVLGLDEDADETEIRHSYEALAAELSPDRFQAASTEVRTAARRAMEVATAAYDAMLAGPEIQPRRTTAELSIDVDRLLQAEREYRKGLSLLEQGRFSAARDAFRRSSQRCPSEAEFVAAQAWATYQSATDDPSGRREAIELLEKAQKLNPRHDRTYVYRGYIYRAGGDDESADAEFERALQCNPDCEEALAELGLV